MRRFGILLCLLLSLSGCALWRTDMDPADAKLPEALTDSQPDAELVFPSTQEPADPEEPVLGPLPPADPEPADGDFVRVADYIPDILVDLRYAGADNFTGTVIYDFTDAYLRYGTVKKLSSAAEVLSGEGYGLMIWDAFRPPAAQFALWEVCPDPVYVADPNSGFSSHSRGNTVDITLTTLDGEPVEMPTDFDDFTALADRDYSDVPESAAANALLLENAMKAAGFLPYAGEWWHFSDSERYGVEEAFVPEVEH